MEASFRFPIKGLNDLELFLTALGACHDLVPGSLRLTGGLDILTQQLAEECRDHDILRVGHAQTPGGLIALFRCLWIHPLAHPAPCVLQLEARLATDPADIICLFLEIPSVGTLPRSVEATGSNIPAARKRLAAVYRSICRSAGLTFEQV
ncbi:MAG TPA: hypothetical protein VF932_16450 [Anaerolineae bacterium]